MLALLLPAVAAHGGGCGGGKGFDYFLFVTQWPGLFPHVQDTPSYFTMHGMWPSRDEADDVNSYPCTCTNEAFDQTQLQPIADDMNKYWVSSRGNNPEFWEHEWSKHGTCSGAPSQLEYFKTVLQIRASIDIFGALKAANITVGTSASAEQYDAAFKQHVGAAALLGCTGGNDLATVSFCLTKSFNEHKVEECTAAVENTHGSETSCDRSKPITLTTHASPSPGPSPHPGPSPAPGPATDSCPHGHHGPSCQADSDCTKFTDCVRCAHSGFCTNEPLTKYI